MNEMKLTVPHEDAGKRIDSWLSEHIDGLTRSAVQNLISEQAVNADGKAVKFAFQCIEPFHRRVLSFPGSGLEENGGNPTDIIQHYARVYNGFHK